MVCVRNSYKTQLRKEKKRQKKQKKELKKAKRKLDPGSQADFWLRDTSGMQKPFVAFSMMFK